MAAIRLHKKLNILTLPRGQISVL